MKSRDGYFFSDVQVRGEYPGYAWEYFKDNDINIEYTDEDMEIIKKYPVDFLSFTYYRSTNCFEGLYRIAFRKRQINRIRK